MEGLEISEIPFFEAIENTDFRIDAEFHRKLPPDNPRYEYVPIGQILEMSQYGISIEMNEEQMGVPIYRMNEISHMLCNQEISKYADISTTEAAPFVLKDNDVLFNRTNSQVFVGRTGIFKSFDEKPRIFASYLVRFRTDESQVLPEYLTAFLNGRFGTLDVKRRARISINQSNVNPEEVKAVRLPLLSKDFQLKLRESFNQAHSVLTQSKSVYEQAEKMLLSELGLLHWQPPEPLTYERKASEAFTSGRLDAEYFSPRVQSLLQILNRQNLSIGKVARLRKEYFAPSRHQTFQYIEISDLTGSGEADSSTIESNEAPDRATWYVNHNDVITSTVRPIRRLSALIHPEQDGFVCSSGFAVLVPHNVPPELLLVYMRLPVIAGLMDLHTTASMYPAISVMDILNIPFLKPSPSATTQLVKYAQESHAARHQATHLLEKAKRAVEIAIEESEAAAMKFLKAESLKE